MVSHAKPKCNLFTEMSLERETNFYLPSCSLYHLIIQYSVYVVKVKPEASKAKQV